jgi:hypothetical protein
LKPDYCNDYRFGRDRRRPGLGDVTANQSEQTTYAITCGQLGSIMRIDVSIFCYTFSSTVLTKVTQNAACAAYTIGSVDAEKLDKDRLRDNVQNGH